MVFFIAMSYKEIWFVFLKRTGASLPAWICCLLAALYLLISFFFFSQASSYASDCKGLDLIRKEIGILHHAKIQVMKDLKGHKDNDPAGRQFISYLEKRIGELCANASLACGTWATKGLPCPPVLPPVPNLATLRQPSHKKDAEAALVESLGEFDEILLEEQKKAEQEHMQAEEEERTAMSEAIQGDEKGSSEESHTKGKEGAEKQGAITQNGMEKGQNKKETSGAMVAGKTNKGQTAQGTSALAKDDDIVARQLREAAEKERDPELRKRLWEEYRKYKEGR